MNRLNLLFTTYSLIALVIIVERLLPSPVLQPFNFIRLHELNQTVVFLTLTVILSFFYLKILTNDFQTLNKGKNSFMALLLLVGTYLYGAGEGWHEVASFTLNTYCDPKNLVGNLCHGLFINDYFAGNIIFFIGSALATIALLYLATTLAMKPFNRKGMVILLANSLVYAFTWFAYAAFDQVSVGLFFSAFLMVISLVFLAKVKYRVREFPFITYSAIAYSLATLASAYVRFLK